MQAAATVNLIDKKELIKEIIKPTTQKKRFYNYLIDGIFFYLLIILFSVIAGVVITLFGGSIEEVWLNSSMPLMENLISMILYALYYVAFEGLFGKSIGKMVTHTKVVNKDGTKPSFGSIVGRSFARIIPFEAFSLLANSRGWHDTLSGTMVVDDIDLYNLSSQNADAENADAEF